MIHVIWPAVHLSPSFFLPVIFCTLPTHVSLSSLGFAFASVVFILVVIIMGLRKENQNDYSLLHLPACAWIWPGHPSECEAQGKHHNCLWMWWGQAVAAAALVLVGMMIGALVHRWRCWCRADKGGVIAGGGSGGSKVPQNLAWMHAHTLVYTLQCWTDLCISPP